MPLANTTNTANTLIIDGFTYNTRIPNASLFYQLALSQLESLRRANGYRPRWFGVPTSDDRPIPAFETVEYQVKVQAGSYLWGLQFSAETSDEDYTEIVNSFRIVDACTELPLQDKPALTLAVANGYFGTPALYEQNTLGQNLGVTLLAEPYLINEPGTLNVEVTNGGSVSSQCQLLLLVAEPCINERELESLFNRVKRIR
jgi:hypothetical protein